MPLHPRALILCPCVRGHLACDRGHSAASPTTACYVPTTACGASDQGLLCPCIRGHPAVHLSTYAPLAAGTQP